VWSTERSRSHHRELQAIVYAMPKFITRVNVLITWMVMKSMETKMIRTLIRTNNVVIKADQEGGDINDDVLFYDMKCIANGFGSELGE
jgi:hypothetical protein